MEQNSPSQLKLLDTSSKQFVKNVLLNETIKNGGIVIEGSLFYEEAGQNNVINTLLLHTTEDYVHKCIVYNRVKHRGTYLFKMLLQPRTTLHTPGLWLIVRAYASVPNSGHTNSMTAEGWAVFREDDEFNHIYQARELQDGVKLDISMAVVMEENNKNVVKPHTIGHVTLHISKWFFMKDMPVSTDKVIAVFSWAARGPRRESIAGKLLKEYELDNSLYVPPRLAMLKRIKNFLYLGDHAPLYGELPAFAFLFGQYTSSNYKYWINLANYLTRRKTMTMYRAPAVRITNNSYMAVEAVYFCLMMPQWLDYLNDVYVTANRQHIQTDYYANAMTVSTLSDDCDGLARAVVTNARALRGLPTISQISDPKMQLVCNAIGRCSQILEYYVLCLGLCGTQTGKASVQSSSTDSADPGGEMDSAHITCYYIPITYFVQCVRRFDPKHPIALLEIEKIAQLHLPVLVGEATDQVEPAGIFDPCPDARAYCYAKFMEDHATTEIFYPRTENKYFFRYSISLTSTDFMDTFPRMHHFPKINVGSFYLTQRITVGGSSQMTKGVKHMDLMGKSPDILIIPGPTYTDKEIHYCMSAGALAPPVAYLVAPDLISPIIEEPIVDGFSNLTKDRPFDRNQPYSTVNLYIKQRQFQNIGFIDQLQQMIIAKKNIRRVTGHVERVVDGVVGICLQFSVQ
jgi:hypothetical protein